MSLYEPDYFSQFQAIIGACEAYPHVTTLPKTGRTVKLHAINSMFYIDIQNMFYILNEIFGSRIPTEIIDYIKKIVFIETLSTSYDTLDETKELICISFIDNNTLLKFHNWLLDYFSHKNDEERLFQKITMSTCQAKYGEEINSMFPFTDSFGSDDAADAILKIAQDSRFSASPYSKSQPANFKPRGKHMPTRKEPSYERPFVCEFHGCRRAFKRLEHLKRHSKMHTGERPFKCLFPGCQKSFSRSDNLNSHYKTHNIIGKRTFPTFEYDKSFENY